MLEIAGKKVYNKLDELVNPKTTALIIVDMQNDFVHSEGFYAKSGSDIQRVQSIIPKLSNLIESARSKGVLIVYAINLISRSEGKLLESPARLLYISKTFNTTDLSMTLEGSWGAKIIDELSPHPGDQKVYKRKSSAFFGTHLDTLLRSNGVTTILVTGVATHGCVEATAREGEYNDYYVVVVSDSVSCGDKNLHDAAMQVMASRVPVATSNEIISVWENT